MRARGDDAAEGLELAHAGKMAREGRDLEDVVVEVRMSDERVEQLVRVALEAPANASLEVHEAVQVLAADGKPVLVERAHSFEAPELVMIEQLVRDDPVQDVALEFGGQRRRDGAAALTQLWRARVRSCAAQLPARARGLESGVGKKRGDAAVPSATTADKRGLAEKSQQRLAPGCSAT